MPRVRPAAAWPRVPHPVPAARRRRQGWRRQHLRKRWLGNAYVSFSMDPPIRFAQTYGALIVSAPVRDGKVERYDLMNARRSALITSAWVVIKPCG